MRSGYKAFGDELIMEAIAEPKIKFPNIFSLFKSKVILDFYN
jgi:hypothetical protein